MSVQGRHNTKPRKKAVETLRRGRDITSETLSTLYQYRNIMKNYPSSQKYLNAYFMNQNKFGIYNLVISWIYSQRCWLVHQLSIK